MDAAYLFHIWIGGMSTCDKESAIQMIKDSDLNPHILYALDIPIIWLWHIWKLPNDPEPELPAAFSPEYFSIHHVYTRDEVDAIMAKLRIVPDDL